MTRFGTLIFLAALMWGIAATAQNATQDELDGHGVIERGAELGDAPLVSLSDVIHDPDAFVGETVTVEGEVGDVCQMKGCWMGIVSPDAIGVRVTLKDYGFFVPRDARGLLARMEGTFEASELTKAEADHLESEGATLSRNPDGTVTELSFVATGVELRTADSSE